MSPLQLQLNLRHVKIARQPIHHSGVSTGSIAKTSINVSLCAGRAYGVATAARTSNVLGRFLRLSSTRGIARRGCGLARTHAPVDIPLVARFRYGVAATARAEMVWLGRRGLYEQQQKGDEKRPDYSHY